MENRLRQVREVFLRPFLLVIGSPQFGDVANGRLGRMTPHIRKRLLALFQVPSAAFLRTLQ